MGNQMSMGDQFLASIKLIIGDNIGNDNFTVSDLARELGLSRSTLHRKLISLTGKSATGLITEIRLERAKELIENDVATISEVAYMAGFTSPSYFNKVFKKAYGISPGKLRNKESGIRTHQSVAEESETLDSPKAKKTRFYAIVGTKLLMVFIVAAAAALIMLELIDLISHSFGLPEQSVNIMIVLLCVGFIIAILLSWLYDLQTDVGLVRTRNSPRVKNTTLVYISSRRKNTTYISIVLIVAFFILDIIQKGTEVQGMEQREKSIAVLPFQNDSPDLENEHIINGIMESITSSLNKVENLRVISRPSVEQFRDTVLPIRELAEYLNVNYILLGSVQKYGDHILLTLNLIDKNDQHLWSEQYDKVINTTEDYYDLQSAIARQVASELHATITPEEVLILERIPTSNIRALGLYRQAREEHTKFWLNNNDLEALQDATDFYRSALYEDPSYGQACSGLAMAIHNSFWAGNWISRQFSKTESRLFRDTILYLAEKAISFDPDLEEAYLVRGNYYYGIRDFNRAMEEYDKALQINPNYSPAYNAKSEIMFYKRNNWIAGVYNKLKAVSLEPGDIQVQLLSELGDYYEMMGFADKAADVYMQTLKINGDSAKYCFDMGGVAYCKRNWNDRLYWFSKSLALEPDQIYPVAAISESYRLLGNIDSACHYAFLLVEEVEVTQQSGYLECLIGTALMDNGQKEEAIRMVEGLEFYILSLIESDIGRKDLNLLVLVQISCIKNQYEKAMEYLSQINWNSLKPLWWIIDLEENPYFENIRPNQEFQIILNTLKSTWQEEHEKVGVWMEENDILLN